MERKKGNSFFNNFYMLGLVFKIAPWRVIHEFLAHIIGFSQWVFFTVVFMKYLFGANEIDRTFEEILFFLSCTAVVFFLMSVYERWFYSVYVKKTNQRIYFELNRTLFEKATSVDISCYENPDFYNSYTRALTEASSRAETTLRSLSVTFASLFSSAYVIYTMFQINMLAGLLAFLPVTGNFLFSKIINKYTYNKDMANVPFVRRINYVNRVMYLQQYAKEIRLTNIYETLKNTYTEAMNGLNKNTDKFGGILFLLSAVKHILCFPLVFEGMWLYAAYCAIVTQSIQIGDFIVLASAIVSTTWMLIDLSGSVTDMYKNANYIQNLKEFINYPPKIDELQEGLSVGEIKELELRNVSFNYGNEEHETLRNITLKIKSGEKIALVGHNGAGKTTLVKLIMRLYDPTEGEILLNGINIKEYNLKQYRSIIGTAFQDFQILSMSVIENIIMKEVESEADRERAVDALKQSGVYEKILTLSKQADTILTKEFDDNGAVLSGGEYQKIATARAFAKSGKILILDEPSSALDPMAEHNMYETIMKLCQSTKNKDKIAVIISHRLSSAINADHIYMLENGMVIEHGSHTSLIAKNGAYADMFIKQAKSYLEEAVI